MSNNDSKTNGAPLSDGNINPAVSPKSKKETKMTETQKMMVEMKKQMEEQAKMIEDLKKQLAVAPAAPPAVEPEIEEQEEDQMTDEDDVDGMFAGLTVSSLSKRTKGQANPLRRYEMSGKPLERGQIPGLCNQGVICYKIMSMHAAAKASGNRGITEAQAFEFLAKANPKICLTEEETEKLLTHYQQLISQNQEAYKKVFCFYRAKLNTHGFIKDFTAKMKLK